MRFPFKTKGETGRSWDFPPFGETVGPGETGAGRDLEAVKLWKNRVGYETISTQDTSEGLEYPCETASPPKSLQRVIRPRTIEQHKEAN